MASRKMSRDEMIYAKMQADAAIAERKHLAKMKEEWDALGESSRPTKKASVKKPVKKAVKKPAKKAVKKPVKKVKLGFGKAVTKGKKPYRKPTKTKLAYRKK